MAVQEEHIMCTVTLLCLRAKCPFVLSFSARLRMEIVAQGSVSFRSNFRFRLRIILGLECPMI